MQGAPLATDALDRPADPIRDEPRVPRAVLGDVALWLGQQGESERAKVLIEAEDLSDAVGACDRGAHSVREAELHVCMSLEQAPALRLEALIDPDDAEAVGFPSLRQPIVEGESDHEASVITQPRRGLVNDVARGDQRHPLSAEQPELLLRRDMPSVVLVGERDPGARIDEDASQSSVP